MILLLFVCSIFAHSFNSTAIRLMDKDMANVYISLAKRIIVQVCVFYACSFCERVFQNSNGQFGE